VIDVDSEGKRVLRHIGASQVGIEDGRIVAG
jgi:hypothetical protein